MQPAMLERLSRARPRADRHRRGALRQPVGPRLPPRVPHARPPRRALPAHAAPGGHRDGRRPHPRGHPRRAASEGRARVRRQLRPAGAGALRRAQARRGRRRAWSSWSRPAARPRRASSMPARRDGAESWPRAWSQAGVPPWPTTPAWTRACASERLAEFLAERRGGDGGDHRLRHGHRQGRTSASSSTPIRRPRSRPTGRRSAAPAATASRPRGSPSTAPADMGWALRRIAGARAARRGAPGAGAQGAPALRHAGGHGLPRRRRAPLFRRDRRRALRPVRPLPVAAGRRVDATEAAQKALSAVHRLGGRFGRGRIVDHLLGKTKEPSEFEAALSTFGVGREFSPAGWRDLIDQLLFEGLLREDPNDGRPLLGLGDADGGARGLSRRARGRSCAARPRRTTRPRAPAGRASAARRRAAGRWPRPTCRCSTRCAPGAATRPRARPCRPT